jgi:hypothetical protein
LTKRQSIWYICRKREQASRVLETGDFRLFDDRKPGKQDTVLHVKKANGRLFVVGRVGTVS